MIFLSENRVRLIAQGYETTRLEPLTFCVTAFPPLNSIASIDSVVNFDGRTGEPFEEVEFYPSNGPEGMAIVELAKAEGIPTSDVPWYTFRSHITGTVEDGVPNQFVIELTLKKGTDPLDFIDELKFAGFFLTSGSDENGNPNHHPFFRQIGSGPIMVGMPAPPVPEAPAVPGPVAAVPQPSAPGEGSANF